MPLQTLFKLLARQERNQKTYQYEHITKLMRKIFKDFKSRHPYQSRVTCIAAVQASHDIVIGNSEYVRPPDSNLHAEPRMIRLMISTSKFNDTNLTTKQIEKAFTFSELEKYKGILSNISAHLNNEKAPLKRKEIMDNNIDDKFEHLRKCIEILIKEKFNEMCCLVSPCTENNGGCEKGLNTLEEIIRIHLDDPQYTIKFHYMLHNKDFGNNDFRELLHTKYDDLLPGKIGELRDNEIEILTSALLADLEERLKPKVYSPIGKAYMRRWENIKNISNREYSTLISQKSTLPIHQDYTHFNRDKIREKLKARIMSLQLRNRAAKLYNLLFGVPENENIHNQTGYDGNQLQPSVDSQAKSSPQHDDIAPIKPDKIFTFSPELENKIAAFAANARRLALENNANQPLERPASAITNQRDQIQQTQRPLSAITQKPQEDQPPKPAPSERPSDSGDHQRPGHRQ